MEDFDVPNLPLGAHDGRGGDHRADSLHSAPLRPVVSEAIVGKEEAPAFGKMGAERRQRRRRIPGVTDALVKNDRVKTDVRPPCFEVALDETHRGKVKRARAGQGLSGEIDANVPREWIILEDFRQATASAAEVENAWSFKKMIHGARNHQVARKLVECEEMIPVPCDILVIKKLLSDGPSVAIWVAKEFSKYAVLDLGKKIVHAL